MVDMQGTANVTYTSGIKQSFKQKIAYMAAENGGDVSIFMNAMDQGRMQTTMDDLLNEAGGTLPDNYDCKNFADKLLDFVKALFNQNPTQKQTFDDFMNQNNDDTSDDNANETSLDFTFDTQTDAG